MKCVWICWKFIFLDFCDIIISKVDIDGVLVKLFNLIFVKSDKCILIIKFFRYIFYSK